MSLNSPHAHEHSDLEEILDLQRQGRRLSEMQMRSLNDYVQRRFSAKPQSSAAYQGESGSGSASNNMQQYQGNSGLAYTSSAPISPPRSQISNYHPNVNANVSSNPYQNSGVGMYHPAASNSTYQNHGAPVSYDQQVGRYPSVGEMEGMSNVYNQMGVNQLNYQGQQIHPSDLGREGGQAQRGSLAGIDLGRPRRRSSMMVNNFINEMGYTDGGAPPAAPPLSNLPPSHQLAPRTSPKTSPDRRRMEKRDSLNLLGDACAAVEQHQRQTAAAAAVSKRESIGSLVSGLGLNTRMSMDMGMADHAQVQARAGAVQAQVQAHAQAQRLNSIDLIASGRDFTSGGDFNYNSARRNSLSQLLGTADLLSPSRRSSLANGMVSKPSGNYGKPIDPYQLDSIFDDPARRMSAAGLPSLNHPSQNNMLAIQLLQQEAQEADEASALSSVEEYIKLQKLTTALRRQSLSNVVGELGLIQDLQNQPESISLQRQADLERLENELKNQLQGQLQYEKIQALLSAQGKKSSNPLATPASLSPKRSNQRRPSFSYYDEDPNEPLMPANIGADSIGSFKSTMDKSQKSQQDIQSWDKKMGLKRSHSATMTKTTRSRKQLRKLFERHMRQLQLKEVAKAAVKKNNAQNAAGHSHSQQHSHSHSQQSYSHSRQGMASSRVGDYHHQQYNM